MKKNNLSEGTNALSTDKILAAAADMVAKMHASFPAVHLDIGAGHGDLIALLRSRFDVASRACDYTRSLMKLEDVDVSVVDLNVAPLPYGDGSVDLVTCTEVLEHVENFRQVLRDMYRVLRPGGTVVLSTPNILNLKSRIRFLGFGFYNLFGPLHTRESALHTTGGHISPISLFYLVHALVDAGFEEIEVAIDKRQGTSMFWLIILFPFLKLMSARALAKEIRRFKTVDQHNERYVRLMNGADLLLGRTVIVGARKGRMATVPC